jgi:hypothetical protein
MEEIMAATARGLGRGVVAAALALALVAGCGKKDDAAKPGDQAKSSQNAPQAGLPGAAETQGQRLPGGDSPVPQDPPAPPAPRVQTFTVAAGTNVTAALQTPISTASAQVGQPISLRTTEAIRSGGRVVVPAGSTVRGRVTHVRSAGRVKGGAELTLRFHEITTPGGQTLAVTADPFRAVTKGSGKQSAAIIGGGAAAGGIIGGVAGGKDDILPGAAIGGILGTGVAVATKGKQIVLPEGTRLAIRLAEPVGVRVTVK